VQQSQDHRLGRGEHHAWHLIQWPKAEQAAAAAGHEHRPGLNVGTVAAAAMGFNTGAARLIHSMAGVNTGARLQMQEAVGTAGARNAHTPRPMD
jgi:hypothetical protein